MDAAEGDAVGTRVEDARDAPAVQADRARAPPSRAEPSTPRVPIPALADRALPPSPLFNRAAALVGYSTSAVVMWGASAVQRRETTRIGRIGILWFMAVGTLNGGALLLTYYALNVASVSVVSPIIATYPLFTMLFSAAFLKTEALTGRAVAGVVLAIAGVVGILVT